MKPPFFKAKPTYAVDQMWQWSNNPQWEGKYGYKMQACRRYQNLARWQTWILCYFIQNYFPALRYLYWNYKYSSFPQQPLSLLIPQSTIKNKVRI